MITDSRLIGLIVFTLRESVVQERLWVEDKLYKVLLCSWCKKSCIHLAKKICQVVYKVLVLGVQNQG